ncbi:MAG: response regulator [Planctomycetota bacterium]|jgi:two-component system chemotaxis response regulator CheY|nr:response regulator [Planctomycetota bacterium]
MTKNILIVDDSATMRKIIMRGLRQAGIEHAEFKEAGDGVEGMKAVEANTFDLILSDVNMPNMNGLDFVKAVTAKMPTPPPIVMITTEGSEEIVKEAISRGAKGYLRKPFTPEKIQEVIGPFLK